MRFPEMVDTFKAADGWLLPESQNGTTIFTFLLPLTDYIEICL
jgi:hypothetical protein